MDRRQKKTREAIFKAFSELLAKKHYNQITVREIIERADVGRATFYSHFETKDFLLRELCEELFCHIFDATEAGNETHHHIFECNTPAPVFVHLLRHLQKNDYNILALLVCENNELFLGYFKENLKLLIQRQPHLFEQRRKDAQALPKDFWVHHAAATFVETIKWWIGGGMRESPETLAAYFELVV